MYVTVETKDGPRKVKVCDYCKTVCCQSRFCCGRCARMYNQFVRLLEPPAPPEKPGAPASAPGRGE